MAGIIFMILITCFFTILTFVGFIFMCAIGSAKDDEEYSWNNPPIVASIISIIVAIAVIVLGSLWISFEFSRI